MSGGNVRILLINVNGATATFLQQWPGRHSARVPIKGPLST